MNKEALKTWYCCGFSSMKWAPLQKWGQQADSRDAWRRPLIGRRDDGTWTWVRGSQLDDTETQHFPELPWFLKFDLPTGSYNQRITDFNHLPNAKSLYYGISNWNSLIWVHISSKEPSHPSKDLTWWSNDVGWSKSSKKILAQSQLLCSHSSPKRIWYFSVRRRRTARRRCSDVKEQKSAKKTLSSIAKALHSINKEKILFFARPRLG
jgi:hypothetical protein